MRRNDQAALLAGLAGTLLAISGYTGTRSVDRMFNVLVGFFGANPVFRVVAFIFLGIASLGGFSVLFGAYLIWKDRVRLGRMFILVGSGAGFFSLLLLLLINLHREAYTFLESVLPALLGVAIGVVARFRAVPKPLLDTIIRP
ncbi:MAG TPA: hypothetical protein VFA17_09525 [Thermoplasmata archaeon]|nr:hypothetical protein [Thermoplasmata archaeon]